MKTTSFFSTLLALLAGTNLAGAESTIMPKWQTQILSDLTALYAPLSPDKESAEIAGQNFEIKVLWESPLEAGAADFDGKTRTITLHGGLLRSAKLTADGLRVLLCHEIGHLYGGAPRKDVPPEWTGLTGTDGKMVMSAEGQSDYYATAVCFRRLARDEGETSELSTKAPLRLRAECEKVYGPKSPASRLCIRAALGGENMLQLSRTFPLSFEKISPVSPSGDVINSYPDRQCRLETLKAGALCNRVRSPVMSALDGNANECKDRLGARPACWYSSGFFKGVPAAAPRE